MKKLILGLCLSFGALYSADDYACTYSAKMWIESNAKAQKAYKLELMAEAQRYINDTKYYTKQVLINCDEKDERYKIAKQLLDSYKEIEVKYRN